MPPSPPLLIEIRLIDMPKHGKLCPPPRPCLPPSGGPEEEEEEEEISWRDYESST